MTGAAAESDDPSEPEVEGRELPALLSPLELFTTLILMIRLGPPELLLLLLWVLRVGD